ncbi:pheromone alpha factor receptor [Sporothrix stenoceras]|uniref:Pheromone alpha factor receptor n=1 Tax=Sporothrix stenoceras TaxID=5173 RepID=A0ABR3YTJ8_9PEZI
MPSSPSPATAPASPGFDPRNQTFYLTGPHNMAIPVWVPNVDQIMQMMLGTSINYGSQIGASLLMLLVTLTLTSKSRFSRAATLINVAGLVISVIRCVLLTLYFTSSYVEFYGLFSGDHTYVQRTDTRISAVATLFALPQLILIEAALFLQAYSMVKLWPSVWRAVVLVVSVLIAVCAIGFKAATVSERVRLILGFYSAPVPLWLNQVDLTFTATTIFWFCFVFIIRLVIHMWEYRSILPPTGGVSAMEVLVMTNGVLMLVPVIFAALQLSDFSTFEAGSLVDTSVIVLLPLGSLIAQTITRPDGYAQRSNANGAGAGSGAGGRSRPGGGLGNSRGGHSGAYSRAATNTPNTVDNKTGIMHSYSNSKNNNDFGTWSHSSDANSTNAKISGGIATQVRIQSNQSGSGSGLPSPGLPGSRTRNNSLAVVDPIEKQLQEIDATSLPAIDGRVWVDREVEIRRGMV